MSQLFDKYFGLFGAVANQKSRKATDKARVSLNKFHLSLFTTSIQRLFPLFIPSI